MRRPRFTRPIVRLATRKLYSPPLVSVVVNMTFAQDMMFRFEEWRAEHELTPRSTFKPIPTLRGCFSVLGVAPQDKQFIDSALADLLAIEP